MMKLVQTVAANTNCHIVALMHDRVERRKYGLRCNTTETNYDFIYSYIHKLNCEPVDMTCYGDNWMPCEEARIGILHVCDIQVIVTLTNIDINTGKYTFTATTTGSVGTETFVWTYDAAAWNTPVQIGNSITLTAIGIGSITTDVTVQITDIRGCIGTDTLNTTYKGGCTDNTAINYDAAATHDNGTCYYENLTLYTTYVCNQSNQGVISHLITGGLAPYTVIGTANGAILADGTFYTAQVQDALGNLSNIQSGTISCFSCQGVNCNGNNNTFQIKVTIQTLIASFGGFQVGIEITSPSGYVGAIKGMYTVGQCSVPEVITTNKRYHSAADETPYVVLNNDTQIGFNQLTPLSPGITDSVWDFFMLQNANIPNWIVDYPIPFSAILFDENDCMFQGNGVLAIPTDGNTSFVTFNLTLV